MLGFAMSGEAVPRVSLCSEGTGKIRHCQNNWQMLMVSLWWIQRGGKCWGGDSPPSCPGVLERTTAAEWVHNLLPRSLRRPLLWPCGDLDWQLEEQLILCRLFCRKACSWVIAAVKSSVTGRSIFCAVRQGAGRGCAKGWAQEQENDWPLQEGRILLKEHHKPLLSGIMGVLGGLFDFCLL